ncbi:MAG: RloB family protein [Clostridia bacterium]|nr:RloB family protein [Clostridia bacterium]
MAKMKKTKKFYFSVEGETENWYLKWLQDKINEAPKATFKVSLDCPVQKNPLKRAKSITITGKTYIYHISDYESNDSIHIKKFKETMDNMKKAEDLGKQITYKFGYTNFTFDLWIILHKADCHGSKVHRKHYIMSINRAYDENFEDMDDYKHERIFKRILNKLSLDDVIAAINRSKVIMQRNKDNGYVLQQYKGYKYYKENPSLSIWEVIEKILQECNLI